MYRLAEAIRWTGAISIITGALCVMIWLGPYVMAPVSWLIAATSIGAVGCMAIIVGFAIFHASFWVHDIH